MTGPFAISRYHLEADWRSVERRLPAEGGSLGEVLAKLTDHVSPALLDEAGWRPVLAAARRWPVTCAALPFGFEFRLRDSSPRADFGLTLLAGGATADWIRRGAREREAPPFSGRLARLLDALGAEDSVLKRQISRVMLEIDIASPELRTSPDPGVFLYFFDTPHRAVRDTDPVLAALNAVAGWTNDPGEFQLAREFDRAMPPGAALVSLGIFPGRGRGVQLTAFGFDGGAEVGAFLDRVGWQGRHDELTGMFTRLRPLKAFGKFGLMLHARGGAVESKLGVLWLYMRPRPAALVALHEGLIAEGCRAEKLAALRPAAMRPVTLWGRAGQYKLMRRLHHVKLVLAESGFEDIKAYTGLVCA